ncbi:MAG: phage/plasmid primase, P4 family [Acidobacteriota bacterium]|jgi:putative DNA primase/helicase|nr:phage/plasmid primase, P4 family [Acidobacteriota bacterium]
MQITHGVTWEKCELVERIRNQVNIMEIAQEHGFDPGPTGKGYCIFCGYKKDRTLYVSEDEQYFKCHHAGCEAKGDVFSFVMLADGVDFPSAVDNLARKVGLSVVADPKDRIKLQHEEDRAKALDKFADFAHSQLTPEANAYLRSRGITEQYADEHKIGLIRRGARYSGEAHDLALLQAAGLVQPGGVVSEKWCNRIIFFFRAGGRIIYFVGRAIDDTLQPRLMNPSLEEMGPKPVVKSRSGSEVWLTEGMFDFVSLDQAGKPAMAILGGASPSKLPPQVKKTVLGFDNDSAGVNFTLKFGLEIFNQGKQVEVLILPQDPGIKDINDCITRGISIDSLERRDFVEWAISNLKSNPLDFEKPVFAMLSAMEPIAAERYFKKIKQESGLGLLAIRNQVKYAKGSTPNGAIIPDGESWFDMKGNFIPPELASHLMKRHYFALWQGDLLVYKDGVYGRGAEDLIDRQVADILGNHYRKNRADEVIANIKARHKETVTLMDDATNIINVKNGLIDLFQEGFPLLPHTPSHLSTIQLPVEYDPAATCPVFDNFILEVVPRDAPDLVEEIFGYDLIYQNDFEIATILYGPDALNGKSTLLKAQTALVGEKNVAAVSLGDIETDRFKAFNLVNKLINLYADLPPLNLKGIGIFKSLVSGDYVSVEKKFGQAFNYRNKAKMIFSCNQLPRVQGAGPDYFRRLIIIPFTASFQGKEDRTLEGRLTTPRELSGILNRALKGLHRLLMNEGRYSVPPSCQRALDAYKGDLDPMLEFFIRHKIKRSDHRFMPGKDIYQLYMEWSKKNEQPQLSLTAFNKQIKEKLNPRAKREANIRGWMIEVGEEQEEE